MFGRKRAQAHETKPVVDAYIRSLPKAIDDGTLEQLTAFHEYAMRLAGELLDASMHDIVRDVLTTLDRRPSAATEYLLETGGGGMLLCGATINPEVNATTQPAGRGHVVLITDRLLLLVGELANLHTARTRFAREDGSLMEPLMSIEQAQARINHVIGWLADSGSTAWESPWDFDEDRAFFAEVIGDEVVTFVLAHELAHILLGHFEQRREEFREFSQAVPGAGAHTVSSLDEIEADALAARLAARRTTREGRGTHHLGALFFFQINWMLEMVASARQEESLQQGVRRMRARARATHPHPLRRLDLAIRACLLDDSTPLESCDAALVTFDEVWHGPRPARSKEALEALEARGAGWDIAALDAVFGPAKWGVRQLLPDDVRNLMEQDGEQGAITWVSVAALSYLAQVGLRRRSVSGERQLRLYVLFGAFHALHLDVPHPSPAAVALEADVRAAIPELDTVLDTYAQVIG